MMNWFLSVLWLAIIMFWETFWALVLGFEISGALHDFVSKEQMSRAFGANVATKVYDGLNVFGLAVRFSESAR